MYYCQLFLRVEYTLSSVSNLARRNSLKIYINLIRSIFLYGLFNFVLLFSTIESEVLLLQAADCALHAIKHYNFIFRQLLTYDTVMH
jgi:hypothetical protein